MKLPFSIHNVRQSHFYDDVVCHRVACVWLGLFRRGSWSTQNGTNHCQQSKMFRT